MIAWTAISDRQMSTLSFLTKAYRSHLHMYVQTVPMTNSIPTPLHFLYSLNNLYIH